MVKLLILAIIQWKSFNMMEDMCAGPPLLSTDTDGIRIRIHKFSSHPPLPLLSTDTDPSHSGLSS
eukprot:scaffold422064_cov98-Attheya_sp.AAC.1